MDERLRLRGDAHAARGEQARLERVLVAVPVDVVPRDMEAVQVVEARQQTMRQDELPQREAVVRPAARRDDARPCAIVRRGRSPDRK